jgi:hypothetical protein
MDGVWRLAGSEGRLSSRSMALMGQEPLRNFAPVLVLWPAFRYPVTATACLYIAENDQHMQTPETFSSLDGKGLVNQIRGVIVTPAK